VLINVVNAFKESELCTIYSYNMPMYLQIRRSGRTRKRNVLYSDEFVMPKTCKKVCHEYINSNFKTT